MTEKTEKERENFCTLAEAEAVFKQAARDYYLSLESDDVSMDALRRDKEAMESAAIIWAQTEIIEQVDKKMAAKKEG